MIELNDTLCQISDLLNRAELIEDTVYHGYLTDEVCDTVKLSFEYWRVKTFHEMLGEYLLNARRLIEKATQQSQEQIDQMKENR